MLKGTCLLASKEIKDYFSSSLVYIIASLFIGITGYLFYFYIIASNEFTNITLANTVLLPLFGAMNFLFMFMIPILTMGQFADEKKHQTLDLLLLSNLSKTQVILGKFLATSCVALFLLSLTVIFPIILAFSGYSEWGLVFSNYFGLCLSIMAYISIGLFASSLTENQVISVIFSFCTLFFILLLLNVAGVTENRLVGQIFQYFSPGFHYAYLAKGLFLSYNVVYFVSFVFFFVFLTKKSLESRSW